MSMNIPPRKLQGYYPYSLKEWEDLTVRKHFCLSLVFTSTSKLTHMLALSWLNAKQKNMGPVGSR
jgi:hypothetical protein